jgi:hypothetical protein
VANIHQLWNVNNTLSDNTECCIFIFAPYKQFTPSSDGYTMGCTCISRNNFSSCPHKRAAQGTDPAW